QLDLVRYLTRLDVVHALGSVATLYADVEVEDSAAAVLGLSNGGLVSVVAAAHSPGASGEERIEIDGSVGRLDLPDPNGGAESLRLFTPAERWVDVAAGGSDMFVEFLRRFA